jgi:hypothetical protein
MAARPKAIQQDRRRRLEETLAIAHAQLRTVKARGGGDHALAARLLSDVARLEGILSRLPEDGPLVNLQATRAHDPTAVPDRKTYVDAVKLALGYAPKSWAAQDAEDVDRLAALAERHRNDDVMVASCLRIIAKLKQTDLPQDVEIEINRLEGEEYESSGADPELDEENGIGEPNDAEPERELSDADLQTD